jgi:hypothetical protein
MTTLPPSGWVGRDGSSARTLDVFHYVVANEVGVDDHRMRRHHCPRTLWPCLHLRLRHAPAHWAKVPEVIHGALEPGAAARRVCGSSRDNTPRVGVLSRRCQMRVFVSSGGGVAHSKSTVRENTKGQGTRTRQGGVLHKRHVTSPFHQAAQRAVVVGVLICALLAKATAACFARGAQLVLQPAVTRGGVRCTRRAHAAEERRGGLSVVVGVAVVVHLPMRAHTQSIILCSLRFNTNSPQACGEAEAGGVCMCVHVHL